MGRVTNVTARKRRAILTSLESGAMLDAAAKAAGISRQTLWRWRREDPDFNAQVEEALMSRIGVVEDALYEAAQRGNITAIVFFLCNRARHRWRDLRHIEGNVYHHMSTTEFIRRARFGFGEWDTN